MRRKLLVTSAVIATLVVAGATNAAWAGTRHGRGGHARGVRPTPTSSQSTRPPSKTTPPTATGPSVTPPASQTASATASAPGAALAGKMFFDDFSYTTSSDSKLAANGWSVRTGSGAPGVGGASWSKNAVTFASDTTTAGNSVMRLRASTAGSGASTVQAEISTNRAKFFAGTYAARVYFNDGPTSGPDGDAINQTFFTITPLRYDDDPIYSELDFEYLPNGGWGASRQTMYLTSWYTYHNSPAWGGDRVSGEATRSMQGWHDVVIQVSGGTVTYFIDGTQVFTSNGKYYPRQAMAIDFNEWFIDGGLIAGSTTRAYDQQVDWVFHVADQVVSPAAMSEQVRAYRASGVAFRDTV